MKFSLTHIPLIVRSMLSLRISCTSLIEFGVSQSQQVQERVHEIVKKGELRNFKNKMQYKKRSIGRCENKDDFAGIKRHEEG